MAKNAHLILDDRTTTEIRLRERASYEHCPDFVELVCHKLDKPPYVCNGCDTRHSCKLNRRLYKAKDAQKAYESTLSESRQLSLR